MFCLQWPSLSYYYYNLTVNTRKLGRLTANSKMQRFIIQNCNRWTKTIEKKVTILGQISLGRLAKFGENRFIFKEIRAKKRCSFLLA